MTPTLPSNEILLRQLAESHAAGQPSEELLGSLRDLTQRVLRKPQYKQFSYLGDLEEQVLLHVCKQWMKFDAKRSANPFAFFSQSAVCAMLGTVAKDRRKRENAAEHHH